MAEALNLLPYICSAQRQQKPAATGAASTSDAGGAQEEGEIDEEDEGDPV